MNTFTISLKPLENHMSSDIYISSALFSRVKCKHEFTLTVGSITKKVEATVFQHRECCFMMSEALFTDFRFPYETHQLRGIYEENTFRLGPVISIVTEVREDEELFGSISVFCKEFVQACKELGCFCYVSKLSDVKSLSPKGYVYRADRWVYSEVPFPGIVHNRIHARKTEQTADFQTFKTFLKEHDVPFFNARYLNKWTVFQQLKDVVYLLPYLPKTYQLRSRQDLLDALEIHDDVFLKPVHGSQGKNIFKISKKEKYILDYTTFTQTYEKEYESLYDLFETLYSQLKRQGFLIQEGISLQTYKQCPFDFRILCHKKDDLTWKITSIVTRVSKPGNFVSNLARGGDIHPPQQVLTQLYDSKTTRHILSLLKEIAIEICTQLSHPSELYAEFGIDLAIDQEGKPWIIEVNVKPSKQSDSSAFSVRPSTKALLDYCLHATNFQFPKEDLR
ncbi:glutathione synthase/RimK-type ligase-like ATP-grasp enzyme [Priestia megaterium]|uniref:YheC/YheD family endospore coat-associated protein n=1 Tax=Priestia megaterium TaxID=1404 RepID=UPI003D1C5267